MKILKLIFICLILYFKLYIPFLSLVTAKLFFQSQNDPSEYISIVLISFISTLLCFIFLTYTKQGISILAEVSRPFFSLIKYSKNLFVKLSINSNWKTPFICLLISSAIVYILMVFLSPNPLEWITNTRLAYLNQRKFVGIFWLLSSQLFSLSYILLTITKIRNRGFLNVLIWQLPFILISTFWGSKGITLGFICTPIVYLLIFDANRLKKMIIKAYSNSIIFLTSVSLIIFIYFSQTSFSDFNNVAFAFKDDFVNTSNAINIIKNDNLIGDPKGILSSIYYLTPRVLFPNKPYEYGRTYMNKYLFPGSAETGHTPSTLIILNWYLLAGKFGIILESILDGFWYGIVFFIIFSLGEKNSLLSYILLNFARFPLTPLVWYNILHCLIALFIISQFARLRYLKQKYPLK